MLVSAITYGTYLHDAISRGQFGQWPLWGEEMPKSVPLPRQASLPARIIRTHSLSLMENTELYVFVCVLICLVRGQELVMMFKRGFRFLMWIDSLIFMSAQFSLCVRCWYQTTCWCRFLEGLCDDVECARPEVCPFCGGVHYSSVRWIGTVLVACSLRYRMYLVVHLRRFCMLSGK